MKRFCLLFAAGIGMTAADEVAPPPAPFREIWVPQSEIPSALKLHPRAVLLTREQFETIRREAHPEATPAKEAPPVPMVLRSLTLTAQPAGSVVTALAEMNVEVLSATPAILPLNFAPAVLATLELDAASTFQAQPADGTQKPEPASIPGALLTPGRHVLKATLHLPVTVSAAGRTIAVRGSPAGAASFALTLPSTDHVESALTWSSKPGAEGTTVHTFILPPGETPHAITWSTRDIRDLPGTALVQACRFVYSIDPVRLHAELGMQFRSRLAALPESLTVPVPPEARILSVDGPGVLRWAQSPDKKSVVITLAPKPDRHEESLTLSLDVPVPPPDPGKRAPRKLSLPFPQAEGTHRASGRFFILTESDLRVRQVTPPPLAVQNTPTKEERAGLGGDLTGMWDFAAMTGMLSVEVEELAPVFHATQDMQIELRRDAVHLTRYIGIVPRQRRLFAVQLTIPPGEELLDITRKDGAVLDWRKLSTDAAAGTLVELRFPSGLKPGDRPAIQVTSRLDPPQWNTLTEAGIDLTFARAAIAGPDKLSGFVAVAAEERFALTTAPATGLELRDPATLGSDVPVRGGFVWFAPGDFKLPLHVSAKVAEFDAHVAAFVLPLLHSIEIEGTLHLNIRQSGLRQLALQLPATVAPFLRFDSPLVSSTKLNAPTGEWAVVFREELRVPQAIRWRMSLPVNDGTAAQPSPEASREFSAEVPAFKFAAARRTSVHWVLEANTDTELSFETSGLDERDTLSLPVVPDYTPRHRVIAAWQARGSDWKLKLTAKRHLPAALPPLVVDRCNLTTSVSTDGTLRHNAILTVRSNGQQFLDLPLPGEARILTLLVNVAPQKPAASGASGLRIQLPAGAVTAITVAVIWEIPGESWNGSGERKIEPLQLPADLPVLESNWTLRLPDGFVYSDFRSDMQRLNGPGPPELNIFPDWTLMAAKRSAGSKAAAPVEYLEGGGGGGVSFRINQSSAPDVYGLISSDLRESKSPNWLDTQIKALTAPDSLLRVVKKLSLDTQWAMPAADAADKLRSMIEINVAPGTEVVTITSNGAIESNSRAIENTLLAEYVEQRKTVEEDRARRLSQQVAAQTTLQEAEVEKARQQMLEVQKKHGIVDLTPLSQGQGTTQIARPGNPVTADKTKEPADEREKQSEYATARFKYESTLRLLNSMKEHQMRQDVDKGVLKMPVKVLTVDDGIDASATDLAGIHRAAATSGKDGPLSGGGQVRASAVAGLLPMEIALPDSGAEFRFRGHQAPGAITFSVRTLHKESSVAWLWITAGIAAAWLLARRRPIFHGLLVTLLLWLTPWILGFGMGPLHQLLIGWISGCGLVLCFRILARNRRTKPALVPAPATVANAALLAVLVALTSQTKADEATAAPPSVIVPYDPSKPLTEQNPQQVYADYEHFQKLWKEARDHRLAKNEPAHAALSGKSGAVLSALYEASLAGGILKVEAVLTIHTTGAWATVELKSGDKPAPFAGASVSGLTIDGKAAALKDGALLVENPGRHVVRASLQAPLTGDWRQFELRLPKAPAALISLTHSDQSLRLKLNGGVPLEVVEKREAGYQWRGTGALGDAIVLNLERLPAAMLAAGSEKPPLGTVRARLFVSPAVERLDSRIDYHFAGAERRDFSFAFDAAMTPVQIDIPNLESWSIRDVDARRVLEFRLSVAARDKLTVGFLAERSIGRELHDAKAPDERHAPAVVPVTNRQEYTLEILSSDDFDLVLKPSGGWARSELEGMGDAAGTGFRSAGAYRLAGAWSPLTWTAAARPLRRSAQADYAWKIAGGILESTVVFTLRAGEHEDLSSLTIPLPPGATLQTLDSDRLKDWWRDGDTLELRFAGATAETTTVWLDFTQPVTAEHTANGLPLPCLTLAGFDEVKGRGVLASGPETDVRLRLDDKPIFVREVAAEQARGDYQFLPPLQIRRGFTFEVPVFHATAILEPVAPRFAVRWVLGAAVQESWTETQFRVDVEIRQGAVPDVRFTMPAGMPAARVTGDKVREAVRTVLADGRAEYRVTFQSPVADAAALVIALELPHQGRLALPDIDFPGAALTERFLIVQNFSGGEIVPDTAASSGVEPLSRDGMQDLHFTVQGFTNPLSWRLSPGWKLAAEHRDLQTTSGPQAVVLWAELTTMLRAEGPEWLRAVYHLQNRALQFLPLRLPPDLELISVTVADAPVRADVGTLADGKPGLLIPLIQTRPGDLAMDVEIVCRVRRPAGSEDRTRKLEDPDIPGVSIQRTLWNVWTPQGWNLDDTGGNMDRIEEGKGFMEKLDADFEELNLLGSLVSSSRSEASRRNARVQAVALVEKMERTVGAQQADRSGSMSLYASERTDGAQLAQAAEKLEQAKKVRDAIEQNGTDDALGDQALPAAASGEWGWISNSGYFQQRGKDSGAAKNREESIIAGNEFLNGSILSGNTVILSKSGVVKKPDEKPKSESRRYNAQIATLNDAQAAPADQKLDTPARRTVIPPTEDDADRDGKREAAQQEFNTVRGARMRVTLPGQQPPATTQPAEGLLPPSNANEPTTTVRPQMPKPLFAGTPLPNAGLPPLATPDQAAAAALAPATTPAPSVPPPPPVLKPAGRVSIPVTIPVDGQVHRFRKVNDGAALELTLSPVGRSNPSRWLASGLLVAGLCILWLVNRIGRKRRQAAAV